MSVRLSCELLPPALPHPYLLVTPLGPHSLPGSHLFLKTQPDWHTASHLVPDALNRLDNNSGLEEQGTALTLVPGLRCSLTRSLAS